MFSELSTIIYLFTNYSSKLLYKNDILLELPSQVNIEKSNLTFISSHSVEIKKNLLKFHGPY